MRRLGLIWLSFLIVGLVPSMVLAFQPHRAIYDLSLISVQENSSFTNVSGRLANEWTKECDGYLFNQRMVLKLVNVNGNPTLMDYQISTWESLDGQNFRFNIRTQIDGRNFDEYVGRARLSGGGGKAIFTKPKPVELALPAETMFPTAHSFAVIRSAERGAKTMQATTFDGSNHDTVYRASLVLGSKIVESVGKERVFEAVRGQSGWPVRLAFFKLKEVDPLPDVEMGFVLYSNGILAQLRLDYDDFSVRGELKDLVSIDTPNC